LTSIFPYVALGLALFLLLWDFFRQRQTSNRHPSVIADEPLGDSTLPAEFTSRIFGATDAEFVAKQGTRQLKRLFVKQRKDIALAWLRCAQADAAALMRVHRAAARASRHLEPLVELRLAWTYGGYLACCDFLAILVRLHGAVNLHRLANYADSRSEYLHELVGRFLPVHLSADRHDRDLHPTGGAAT